MYAWQVSPTQIGTDRRRAGRRGHGVHVMVSPEERAALEQRMAAAVEATKGQRYFDTRKTT